MAGPAITAPVDAPSSTGAPPIPAPTSRVYVVAPIGTGKSTIAELNPGVVATVDSALTPAVEARLRPLRAARDWPAYNTIYHDALREWVRSRPERVILVHSPEAAAAMAAVAPGVTKVWLLPVEEQLARLLDIARKGETERAELGISNRADVALALAKDPKQAWDPASDNVIVPHVETRP